jgi:hypothetical protein
MTRWLLPTLALAARAAIIPADLTGVRPGPVAIAATADSAVVRWPDETGRTWTAAFSLDNERPLIRSIAAGDRIVVEQAAPLYWIAAGKRRGGWDQFFDFPPSHPQGTRAFTGRFQARSMKARTVGERLEVFFDGLDLGIFRGAIAYTFYPGSRLIQQEAVVSTNVPDTAYYYDAGIRWLAAADRRAGNNMDSRVVFHDMSGRLHTIAPDGPERTVHKPRYRTIAARTAGGAVAVFPAPHQYFFARDFTTNMGYLWSRAWRGQVALGIRQLPDDNTAFYPWMNAPPGTSQRLSLFLWLTDAAPESALGEVRRFTNRDRFPALEGYKTLAAHWHFAYTVQAMEKGFDWTPPFKPVLREMGVDAAMIADFHGDGHPRDTGETRLRELEAYFRACRAQSDAGFLLIPSEEANVHYGGHWAVAFPKPVYWIMSRPPGTAFATPDPKYGTVYRTGSPEEMLELIRREDGIAYQTHPRTKGSMGFPDKIRESAWFRDPAFIGAGWKQMPSDLATLRQGLRSLNLLDDMNNWGLPKLLLGEVDVFQIDSTHELYAHMNVNYVRMPELPSFDNYGRMLEALRRGEFFVSTGEVLLPAAHIAGEAAQSLRVRAEARWTFPLASAEIVWGDGDRTHRKTFPLDTTRAFGTHSFDWTIDAPGWKWARLEVWDVAGNGAFTNPVRRPL